MKFLSITELRFRYAGWIFLDARVILILKQVQDGSESKPDVLLWIPRFYAVRTIARTGLPGVT